MILKLSSGIKGLDAILNGGYLKNKPTLIKGGPGTGKTVFTLFFAYSQLLKGEKVIYISCDESPKEIIAHMHSFNLNPDQFIKEGKLSILDVTPSLGVEIIGDFDISAILLRLQQAQEISQAKTIIIDSLQSILLGFKIYDASLELLQLFEWTRQKKMTVLCTIAEELHILPTKLYEEYIVDCAIELKQAIHLNLMTRFLRIIKMRGSSHGTNQYPFAINSKGIGLLPVTESKLTNQSSSSYISTGIPELDGMLGNQGIQEGSCLMLTGQSGTGKTIFASSLALSALKQKKRLLFVSFEESEDNLIQHLRSAGINLKPFVETKQLSINVRRSSEMGLEEHIISIMMLMEEGNFDCIVLDPISALVDLGSIMDLKMLFIRFVSLLNNSRKTIIFTELIADYKKDRSDLCLSSITDSWIRLRREESNGELNRILCVAKSRGTKTSNQLREYLITDQGIQIEMPYIGDGEMVFGSQKATRLLQDEQLLQKNTEELQQISRETKALNSKIAYKKLEADTLFEAEMLELQHRKARLERDKLLYEARKQKNKQLRG